MGGILIFSNEFWALLWAVNTILAFYVVFHRKRSVATSWAWLIILLIFPILGFILYGFIGRGLSQENLFAINNQKHIGLNKVNKMIPRVPKSAGPTDTSKEAKILIDYFNFKHDSPFLKTTKSVFILMAKRSLKLFLKTSNKLKKQLMLNIIPS